LDDALVLLEDGERRLRREWRRGPNGEVASSLVVQLVGERPSTEAVQRLIHEHALGEMLDSAWALRPVALLHDGGRHALVFEDPGGEPLEGLLREALPIGGFLDLAIDMTEALAGVHARDIVHKDIKPANVMVHGPDGRVRLTGFGIATRLARERQAPDHPEFIAGTLAYMAPEQTGRMNRSIDARSDLYSLGATFYRMLTGNLPFNAADPMEWVHCHIARQPLPPAAKLQSIPETLSNLVMKLLAKTAEERYQTATGLEFDLRRCLAEWHDIGRVGEFPLGQRDVPHRLLIPEKLYGREHDVRALLDAFDHVVQSGSAEMVLVSGYSGIGKSSVVHELRAALVLPRGWFASGKADQYKRDIPYSTLAQAFHGLVRSLLSKSPAELLDWRRDLLAALDPYGRLITDLVPDLALIIGEQPRLPLLDPQQAKGRFQRLFRRFISVFAAAEHPLALFVDDLQWSDDATLELLEDLMVHPEVGHLLLVGAYRDNEVGAARSLLRKVGVIRESGVRVSELILGPLAYEHIMQLTTDALRFAAGDIGELARLVHAKAAGNPFFVFQFLQMLADEGLLVPSRGFQGWSWDLERIDEMGYADNVAGLMTERLTRLPQRTQAALSAFACLGNVANVDVIASVLECAEPDLHLVLWDAVRLELVTRSSGQYRFAHDRVQEAAYSAMPHDQRAHMHLHIGRLLAARHSEETWSDAIFDVVNHLNRGASLIDSAAERLQLAELDLAAGRRAKESTAHSSALRYFSAGASMLPGDVWDARHELAFEIEFHRAESEFLTGSTLEAERRLTILSGRARSVVEHASVACLQMDAYINLDRLDNAVGVGLAYLRPRGGDWPSRPTQQHAQHEFERVTGRLKSGNPVELPFMSEPLALATLDVLVKVMAATHYTDPNLTCLAACRAVDLCLDVGNSDASCIAYLFLAAIAGRFGELVAARRFGNIGFDLVEVRGLKRFQARAYVDFASLGWMRHVRQCRDIARRAFDVGIQSGDIIYATHSCWVVASNRIAAGDPLDDVQREVEAGLAIAKKARFGFVAGIITVQLGLIRTLRGLTPKFGSFEDAHCNDLGVDGPFSGNLSNARVECWYWIRKLQARFFAGDYAAACEASIRAKPLLWTSTSNVEAAEYHFFSALSLARAAAQKDDVSSWSALVAHHRQLKAWAAHCPENFENRATLVAAEIARLCGRDRQAMDLYEHGLELALRGGYIHIEALGNELAASFYFGLGLPKVALTYLRDARYSYRRWGAHGKVRQLDAIHPELEIDGAALSPTPTIGEPLENLDLATVIKATQALSGEIQLPRLIERLMRIAVEHAGAERGLLILIQNGEPRIVAEATTSLGEIKVAARHEAVLPSDLPQSVLNYALRTRERVLVDDAFTDQMCSADSYVRLNHSRSVLCVPIVKQNKLVGSLYLENSLLPGVFTSHRVTVLELLASQASISLENAALYSDLQLQVELLHHIPVSAWTLGPDGTPEFVNQVWLEFAGQTLDFVKSNPEAWMTAIHPEDRERAAKIFWEGVRLGRGFAIETRSLRARDGVYRWHLQRAEVLRDAEGNVVKFVGATTDIDDQKRTEETLRQTQADLAHVERVATLNAMTASITHEISQPLSGILTNANTCLRMLIADQPNLHDIAETARRTVRDANRATDVIRRLRAMFSNKLPTMEMVDLNDAAREVIALSSGEMRDGRAFLQTDFAGDLPRVSADRVQLQQVILNLLLNATDAMKEVEDRPRALLIKTYLQEDGSVVLAVRDSGSGVDLLTVEKLFEAFYTTKPNGMGVGLSICRLIVESHRGRLWASPNIGPGATFSLCIPCGSPNQTVAA
jgi:PAS domain S-box-containing protein